MSQLRRTTTLIALLLFAGIYTQAQTEKAVPSCSQTALAALKSVPKLEYECPEGLIDSDERILGLPKRLAAIRDLTNQLTAFTDTAWWQADLDELRACKIHGSAGDLAEDEKEAWKRGDYGLDLFGNQEIRLALIPDPCYQSGFNGSNAFLLHRTNGKVVVSHVLNGYYSRADNSVEIAFANLNGRRLVQILTGNSMPPSITYYFFVIEPRTKKAAPRRIFKEGGRLVHVIHSAMLLSELKDLGLPPDAAELQIIQNKRLAPAFSVYEESERGRIDDNGRKLRRIIYRWNGRFYQSK